MVQKKILIYIFQNRNKQLDWLYIYIYIERERERENSKKLQLEFEIRIQFCTMCLNLGGDHTIIIHFSFLIFVPSKLISAKY